MRNYYIQILDRSGWPGWLVPDYYHLVCLAIAIGAWLTLREWRRNAQSLPVGIALIGLAVPFMLFGGKLFYLLQFGFPDNWSGWFRQGASLYGGFFGFVLCWVIIYWIRPYPFLLFLDCTTPAFALGLFVGRLGCFLHGCNGGQPSLLPWAIAFPPGSPVYEEQLKLGYITHWTKFSLPVHPTQLYEAAFGLICFALLFYILPRKQWQGQVFCTGMLWYGIYRFFTEPLRADQGNGWFPFGVLTFAQLVSLLVILSTALVLMLGARQATNPPSSPRRKSG